MGQKGCLSQSVTPCPDAGPVWQLQTKSAASVGPIWHGCIAICPTFIDSVEGQKLYFCEICLKSWIKNLKCLKKGGKKM